MRSLSLILVVAAGLFAAACGTSQTAQEGQLASCATYNNFKVALTGYINADRLTERQVELVQGIYPVVDEICINEPDESDLQVLEDALLQLLIVTQQVEGAQ